MFKRFRKHIPILRRQNGDTIVEVMISLAVISLVLVGVMQVSGSSQTSVRDAQEHSQATELAKSQIEFLRANKDFDAAHSRCFNSTGVASPSGPTTCDFNQNGASSCNASNEAFCYHVVLAQVSTTAADPTNPFVQKTYRVTVTWDRLDGGKGSVSMLYKISIANAAYVPVAPPTGGGGGGGGGDDVVADVANDGCDDSGVCDLPGTLSYRITFKFVSTTLDPSQIAKCNWNWGDGTAPTALTGGQNGCKIGTSIAHTYPEIPGYPTGAPCVTGEDRPSERYSAKLLVTSASGSTISSSTQVAWTPWCHL